MNSACSQKSLADASKPSKTVLLLDEALSLNDGNWVYANLADQFSVIHLDMTNFAYLDGHVKSERPDQTTSGDFTF